MGAERTPLLLLLAFLAAASAACAPLHAATSYECDFSSGAPRGSLRAGELEGTRTRTGPRGLHHLVLDSPGKSRARFSFTLDRVPHSIYLVLDHRTARPSFPGAETYEVRVNDQSAQRIGLSLTTFVLAGYDITPYCRPGENTVEVRLLETADTGLWLRRVQVTSFASLVEEYTREVRGESLWARLGLLALCLLALVFASYPLYLTLWLRPSRRGLSGPAEEQRLKPATASLLTLLFCTLTIGGVTFAVLGLGLLSALVAVGLGILSMALVYLVNTAT